jgi:hypothetical protein
MEARVLSNREELRRVLGEPTRLGMVFARHAYGMRRWVDLFSGRIATIEDPQHKELVATLVADNARHMNLLRARALAHGVDPDAYRAPAEGELIYERLDHMRSFEAVAAYALASLDHFAELLAVYGEAAEGDDAAVVASVHADVDRMRAQLRPVASGGEDAAAEAHELYRVRELAETPRYALAG